MNSGKTDPDAPAPLPTPITAPGDGPLALARFLPYRLSVIAERVSHLFARRYETQFDLSIPEWRVIAVIGESGVQSTQQVIERTRMDRVRVSRAAIRLSDKGLIERVTNPRDQRAQIMGLTDQGFALYHQIIPLARAIQAELAAGLTEAEQAQLDQILQKLDQHAATLEASEA